MSECMGEGGHEVAGSKQCYGEGMGRSFDFFHCGKAQGHAGGQAGKAT